MTTIAFDGTTIAADTQFTDSYGLRNESSKIFVAKDFIAASSGEYHVFMKWFTEVKQMSYSEVISYGLPIYDTSKESISIMVIRFQDVSHFTTGSVFMQSGRNYHAIGSGRDYAMAAMRCGKTASEAVKIAAEFDAYTGGNIDTLPLTVLH